MVAVLIGNAKHDQLMYDTERRPALDIFRHARTLVGLEQGALLGHGSRLFPGHGVQNGTARQGGDAAFLALLVDDPMVAHVEVIRHAAANLFSFHVAKVQWIVMASRRRGSRRRRRFFFFGSVVLI